MNTTKPSRKTRTSPAEARRRRIEAEVKRILGDRDPGRLLAEMRAHLDEMPRDQVDLQREIIAIAAARYAEMTRGHRG